MTMTDPIADMLTRLRNANQAYHDSVSMPNSKLKAHIAEILKERKLNQYIEELISTGATIASSGAAPTDIALSLLKARPQVEGRIAIAHRTDHLADGSDATSTVLEGQATKRLLGNRLELGELSAVAGGD